jgi:hypothetical protein
MVLLLATSLDVPLRERNRWLLAAGYAPMYRETVLTAPEMRPAQQALEFVLQQQEPYPALVMDRQWNLLRSNQGRTAFSGSFSTLRTCKPPARPTSCG